MATRRGGAAGRDAGTAPRSARTRVTLGPREDGPVPRPAPRDAGSRPVGVRTRGTTGTNRLRRIDRWLAGPGSDVLRAAADPLVVDLGFGASPVTTLEMARRLAALRPDVEVVGLEVDPVRVATARRHLEAVTAGASSAARVTVGVGGFELGGPASGRRPVLVRAANVLRQYPEGDVAGAWDLLRGRLAPGGSVVDATCDEVGRRCAFVVVGPHGPLTLVLSLRLAGLGRPSDVAERLPKALIHRNVPGERVHAWLQALDDAWDRAAPLASFGARQRWLATCRGVQDAGWPVLGRTEGGGPARWRLGEVAVAWDAVAP